MLIIVERRSEAWIPQTFWFRQLRETDLQETFSLNTSNGGAIGMSMALLPLLCLLALASYVLIKSLAT